MPRIETRALAAHDGGQEAGGRPVRGLLRSRSSESIEKFVRTSQGVGREGK